MLTLTEENEPTILRKCLGLSPLLCLLSVEDSVDELTCLSVDVHLLLVETDTLNEGVAFVPSNCIELVFKVPPVQVDTTLV
jgi:hypothetical protein